MNIHDLVNRTGSVTSMLGITPGPDGLIDLSDGDWENAQIVLRRLTFTRVRLEGKTIRPNLVECRIEDSRFARLRSSGHFWGAENQWQKCRYHDVILEDAISPQTRFEDCDFVGLSLIRYRPCETVFQRCRFQGLSVIGMEAVPLHGQPCWAELQASHASLAFVDCVFERPIFRASLFRAVAFRNCTVADAQVCDCDFTDADSDQVWWPAETGRAPFVAFLDEVLMFVEGSLGKNSDSYRRLSAYRADFTSGRTTDKDYSACLYDGSVPGTELDVLEDALDRIEAKYSW